jgi:hypothetical protein
VKFAEEAMMHIHAGVPVSVHFIATVRTPEQFPPFHSDALAVLEGEPPLTTRFLGEGGEIAETGRKKT